MSNTENTLQKYFDKICAEWRKTRSENQYTLGKMINLLNSLDKNVQVRFSHNTLSPAKPHSYRGYYSDLAFETSDKIINAGQFLAMCEESLDMCFEGYKGGDFVMGEDTPLWCANYSETGPAIVDVEFLENILILMVEEEV